MKLQDTNFTTYINFCAAHSSKLVAKQFPRIINVQFKKHVMASFWIDEVKKGIYGNTFQVWLNFSVNILILFIEKWLILGSITSAAIAHFHDSRFDDVFDVSDYA